VKIGDRVRIIGIYADSCGKLGSIVAPYEGYDWLVQRDGDEEHCPIPFYSSELQLISTCPCSLKACISHRSRKNI
jgi:hypothetical protein